MVDVGEGELYSVCKKKLTAQPLYSPESRLYQKLDFMVFQLVIVSLSATMAKKCAVNKHRVSQACTPKPYQLRLISLNAVIFPQRTARISQKGVRI